MNLVREDETLDDLQLKGMYIIQKKDAFRFGVDAVLLANYAKIKKGMRVIDLCSGTGIIPIIIGAKTEASNITGMEIQEEMVDMANRSAEYNGVSDKIQFIHGDLRDKELLSTLPKADVITVNPPYKLVNSGIINSDRKNAIARHEICCKLEDVIKACRTILKDNGRMFMIHRPERLADILCLMRAYKIEPKTIKMIHPDYTKAPSMLLIEGQRDGGAFLKLEAPLYIHNPDGSYTKELRSIYESEVSLL